MQIIISQNSPIHFGISAYTVLADYLKQSNYSTIFILTDTNTVEFCLPHFLRHLATDIPIEVVEIEAGEEHKNIETSVGIWETLSELGADRKSVMITLGGGVITDIGGFTASTFKRGIDYINIPTSLLAMVDASVGGKTGIDLGGLKNEIGTFTLPKMVVIDGLYLDTLPQLEMQSGFAEMFKHGLIADYSYWKELIDMEQLSMDDLERLIHRSVTIKNEMVLNDLTEKKTRKCLNFGHTLGHAIETYHLSEHKKKTVKHGFAVAAGMVLEAYLSYKKGLISFDFYHEIKTTLLGFYGKLDFSAEDIEVCLSLLKHDKKNENGKVLFSLLKNKGESAYNQEVETDWITEAFTDYVN